MSGAERAFGVPLLWLWAFKGVLSTPQNQNLFSQNPGMCTELCAARKAAKVAGVTALLTAVVVVKEIGKRIISL